MLAACLICRNSCHLVPNAFAGVACGFFSDTLPMNSARRATDARWLTVPGPVPLWPILLSALTVSLYGPGLLSPGISTAWFPETLSYRGDGTTGTPYLETRCRHHLLPCWSTVIVVGLLPASYREAQGGGWYLFRPRWKTFADQCRAQSCGLLHMPKGHTLPGKTVTERRRCNWRKTRQLSGLFQVGLPWNPWKSIKNNGLWNI